MIRVNTRMALAVGIFLIGTMYLWASPAFVKPSDVREGAPSWSYRFFSTAASDATWSQALLASSLMVVALFGIASYGFYRGEGEWWIWIGALASLLGILVLLPWWIAVGPSAPAISMIVNGFLLLCALGLTVVLLSAGLRAQAVRLVGGG